MTALVALENADLSDVVTVSQNADINSFAADEATCGIKAGDKIVTIGGICGVIQQITDNKIFIEIADGIVIEMLRNSISSVETEEDLKDPFAEEEDDDEEDDDIYYDENDEDIIDLNEEKSK